MLIHHHRTIISHLNPWKLPLRPRSPKFKCADLDTHSYRASWNAEASGRSGPSTGDLREEQFCRRLAEKPEALYKARPAHSFVTRYGEISLPINWCWKNGISNGEHSGAGSAGGLPRPCSFLCRMLFLRLGQPPGLCLQLLRRRRGHGGGEVHFDSKNSRSDRNGGPRGGSGGFRVSSARRSDKDASRRWAVLGWEARSSARGFAAAPAGGGCCFVAVRIRRWDSVFGAASGTRGSGDGGGVLR